MENLAIVYELLVKPRVGIRAAAQKHSLGLAVFIVFISSASGTVANALVFSQDPTLALISLSSGLIFRILSVFVGLFLLACILHFVAEGLNGEGRVSLLFIALGCSLLPGILISPLSLIAAAIGPFPLRVGFYLISEMVIFLWMVTLQIMAVKEVYRLSSGRAILTYLIPQIAVLLLLFILSILFFSALIMAVIKIAS